MIANRHRLPASTQSLKLFAKQSLLQALLIDQRLEPHRF